MAIPSTATAPAPALRRASTISSTQEVYTRLREMLLNGEIAPGAVLSQVVLARELGVSTTPLREAMRLLQADGLLLVEHNRRSRVASLEPADIDAVYSSRMVLEAVAIRLTVPRLAPTDLAALRQDLVAMRSAGEAQDLTAWEPIHRGFHQKLISGTLAPAIALIVPLVDRCERYRRSSLFGSSARTWELGNDEHESIVEACEARDPEQAAALLARHYARSALTILTMIAPDAEPQGVRTALKLVQQAATEPVVRAAVRDERRRPGRRVAAPDLSAGQPATKS